MDALTSPYGFTFLLIFVGLFFALRAVFLWYWRVNTLVAHQARLIELAEQQLVESRATNALLARMSADPGREPGRPRVLAVPNGKPTQ